MLELTKVSAVEIRMEDVLKKLSRRVSDKGGGNNTTRGKEVKGTVKDD